MRSFRDLVCVVGLLAIHSCIPHIRPDRPQYLPPAPPTSAQPTPPALVTSGLPVSLASAFEFIENNTPREVLSSEWDGNLAGDTGWILDESDRGLRYRYHLWRSPMRMSISGDVFNDSPFSVQVTQADVELIAAPEPAALALLGLAACPLVGRRASRRR